MKATDIMRMDQMSEEELKVILQNTAEDDRTVRAEWHANTNDSLPEALAAFESNCRVYGSIVKEERA
ncbi:MAG: hypothetical protein WCX97_02995 [Candidatus Magasanikbacteria bacterium]